MSTPYAPPKKVPRLPGEDPVSHEIRDRGLTLKPHVKVLREFIAMCREGDTDPEADAATQAVTDILEMFNLLKQVSGVQDLERLYTMLQIPVDSLPHYTFVQDGAEQQRLLSYVEHWDSVRRLAAEQFPEVWGKVFFPARFTLDEQREAAAAKTAGKASKATK